MRCAIGVVGIIASLATAWPVSADEDSGKGLGIGLVAGTTGIGGELTFKAGNTLVIRPQGSWLAIDHDFTGSSTTFNLRANIVSAGASLDWHPFAGSFRLSAGGRYHNIDFTGTAAAAKSYTIGSNTYTAAQIGTLNASVKSASTVAPYLGLGWDSTHFSAGHWALGIDLGAVYLGAVYMGKPDATITTTSTVAGLSSDIAKEQQKLQDSVGKYGQFWPIATLALKYRF